MGIKDSSDLCYGFRDERRARPHVGARRSNVTSTNMYTNYQNLVPARGFVGIVLAPKLWNCRIKRAIEVISADTKQRQKFPYAVPKVYNSTIIAVGHHLSPTKIEVRFPRIDPFSHGTISMTDSIEWGVDIGKSTGTGKIDRPHY
jgi:hypothetical protein